MQIWLPPSEGKISPSTGPTLDLDALAYPRLNSARRDVISALQQLAEQPDAAEILKLGKRSSAEAHFNEHLWTSPCGRAIDVYTGVLFDALDAPTLTPAQASKLDDTALIMSGLFGLVRPFNPIPNHRLAIGVDLPPLGRLGAWWRKHLENLFEHEGVQGSPAVVLDLRSKAYQAMAPLDDRPTVEFNVVRESQGARKAVSHWAKYWRGLAARHVVQDPKVSADAGLSDLLHSLQALPSTISHQDEDAAGPKAPTTPPPSIEIGEPKQTRRGGTKTEVTMVVRS